MFRLVTFNILNGAHTPPERLDSIVSLLDGLRADLIFLQECVDWNEDQVERLASQLEMGHSYLTQSNPRGSGLRYNLVALSRRAFSRTLSHTPSVLAHACQEIALVEVPATFHNLHLIARAESERVAEIDWFLDGPRQGILAGDLNCLSPLDPYNPELAQALVKSGVEKYGNPIEFAVFERLTAEGWRGKPPVENGREDGYHWVTRWRTEVSPPLPTRTDYVLATPETRPALLKVWNVDLKHRESDHNPVVADFDWDLMES